ncbi:MAG: flavin reductase family protein [Flavobacteriales bacterium]|nr:flavin reductase family protein [Flavobacteriales bacterium]MCB9165914.1 flavin reductase family protein [Flavobacteriales bacterium]
MKRFELSTLTIPQRHGLLLGAVGPRPIAFASTIDAQGRPNLSPFSFFNIFGSNPPTLIFSPARRGRDNTTKDTLHNVEAVPEVVINVVTWDLVHQATLSSTEYPAGVNEFEKAGLTMLPSERIRPFRVKESPVQLECVVKQVVHTGDSGAAGNLVICEALVMHVREDLLNDKGLIDQRRIDLVARMGGHFYCRAHGDALFELPQPTTHVGMGVDALPRDIRESGVLTGRDLAKLADRSAEPDAAAVNEHRSTSIASVFQEHAGDPKNLHDALHRHAHALLEKDRVDEAWMTLLAYNEH